MFYQMSFFMMDLSNIEFSCLYNYIYNIYIYIIIRKFEGEVVELNSAKAVQAQ